MIEGDNLEPIEQKRTRATYGYSGRRALVFIWEA